MGTAQRREREKADLRRKILAAARELFVAQGADSVTLRKVGERIEYSPTVVYSHFQDKEALLLALCEDVFSTMWAEGMHLLEIKDPVERIVRSSRFYIDFALRHEHHYEFMFMSSGLELAVPAQSAIAVYTAVRHAFVEAIDAGRFRPEWSSPGPLLHALWAALHGVASLQIAGRYKLMREHPQLQEASESLSPQKIAEVAIEAILRGFLRDSGERIPAVETKAGPTRKRPVVKAARRGIPARRRL